MKIKPLPCVILEIYSVTELLKIEFLVTLQTLKVAFFLSFFAEKNVKFESWLANLRQKKLLVIIAHRKELPETRMWFSRDYKCPKQQNKTEQTKNPRMIKVKPSHQQRSCGPE